MQLSSEDCCAVDLILERDEEKVPAIGTCFSDHGEEMAARLTLVDQLLKALHQLPEFDAPMDMKSRLLARCEQAMAAQPPPPEVIAPVVDPMSASSDSTHLA